MNTSSAGKASSFRKKLTGFFAHFAHELRVSRVALLPALGAIILLSLVVRFISLNEKSAEPGTPVDFSVSASIVDEDRSLLGKLLISYLEDVRYVSAIHDDSFDTAMRRIEDNEIVVALRLPPQLFELARTGSEVEPVELWLNPRMPAESGQIAVLVRQYATAFNHLYGNIFGYQKLYVELGGDYNDSWRKATNHSMNVLIMYLDRDRYVSEGDLLSFNILNHVLTGVLIIFSLLPAMGVLAGTIRISGTAYEDRLLLSLGSGIPGLTRLLIGAVWWAILIVPPLIALSGSEVIRSILPIGFVLLASYFSTALLMLALGRVKAPGMTVLQAGWLVLFLLIVMGGILYPTSLFPDWLNKIAHYTPVYPAMRSIYRSLYQQGLMPFKTVLMTAWPIIPASVLAFVFGRRRV